MALGVGRDIDHEIERANDRVIMRTEVEHLKSRLFSLVPGLQAF